MLGEPANSVVEHVPQIHATTVGGDVELTEAAGTRLEAILCVAQCLTIVVDVRHANAIVAGANNAEARGSAKEGAKKEAVIWAVHLMRSDGDAEESVTIAGIEDSLLAGGFGLGVALEKLAWKADRELVLRGEANVGAVHAGAWRRGEDDLADVELGAGAHNILAPNTVH